MLPSGMPFASIRLARGALRDRTRSYSGTRDRSMVQLQVDPTVGTRHDAAQRGWDNGGKNLASVGIRCRRWSAGGNGAAGPRGVSRRVTTRRHEKAANLKIWQLGGEVK
jgi:hypothetical protein